MVLGFIRRFTPLILSAGLTLLLVFIVLSGAINHTPIDKFYWLQADTSTIPGAPALSRWTFWGLSENSDGSNESIIISPAYPISPVDNFGTTENVPQDFIDNRDTYYYLTRVGFGAYFAALGLVFFSLILSVFAMCSVTVLKVNAFLVAVYTIFTLGAAALYTAASVKAKNAFHDAGIDTKLGPAMFGIAWASGAIALILFFLTCANCCLSSYQDYRKEQKEDAEARERYEAAVQTRELREAEKLQESGTANAAAAYQQNQGTIPAATESSGVRFFKIKRNQKDVSESD